MSATRRDFLQRDFNYQSDPADRALQRAAGRANRGGPGWFSFDVPVDGTSIARFEPNAKATGFYDVRYAVPADVVRGKSKITVRLQAAPDSRIAPVFGVRTVRANGD